MNKRHHDSDKIGIGHLPRAAVVAAVPTLPFDDDDRLAHRRHDALFSLEWVTK
jgi:hypothetical protein